jgi:23S rRNA (adenine2503-C2)-methyltransferase
MKTSAFSLNSVEWSKILVAQGCSEGVLNFWLEGLYKESSIWDRHISVDLISALKEEFSFDLPQITFEKKALDGTVKFQVRFEDGLEVETVLIPFHKRYTVCLSTQVGCAMNCSFCYTGTQGLKRHLTAGEIVGQYLVAKNWLTSNIPNSIHPRIVFMGQGEPLHNVDELLLAIRVLTDRKTIALGPREITLSTVGYLPGLAKLHEFPRINFALSLHSPFQDERSELIPINQKYELSEVLAALDRLPQMEKRVITYEYLLIRGFNMSEKHAEELARLLGQRRAVLNLIPFNPFPGSKWERPLKEEIDTFKEHLVGRKLRAMVRTTKGDEILAACGQLKIDRFARNYDENR